MNNISTACCDLHGRSHLDFAYGAATIGFGNAVSRRISILCLHPNHMEEVERWKLPDATNEDAFKYTDDDWARAVRVR